MFPYGVTTRALKGVWDYYGFRVQDFAIGACLDPIHPTLLGQSLRWVILGVWAYLDPTTTKPTCFRLDVTKS